MRRAVGTAVAAVALVWGGSGGALALDPPSPAPSHSGHDMSDMDHDMPGMTEEEMAEMDEPAEHQEHGGTPDTVSSGTRTVVLSGFAIVNAGVLGGALVVRRHDRRHPRHGTRAGRAAR
jgi:hypothetical protein